MFSFQLISVLLISVRFYTYFANIVFGATWPLNLVLKGQAGLMGFGVKTWWRNGRVWDL